MSILSYTPGTAVVVNATGSSQPGTIAMADNDGMHIANTSTTLYVQVRWGVGNQTAVTTDLGIPPMSQVLVRANKTITGVAAIGSAAGPTAVIFTPVILGAQGS
ncbi:MAG: hypothetical protein FJZ00_00205 [Candidatus Sericytochromatia bacterium]|uniref:Uncharacterized protein n=1 Tax=Candidatus Tanganyikabacteria bacterium TaxID=2961651 RepID=A0A938BHM2_9BACT|nr:hypothetical protein [Candidatus Tanganyikabacteria bacterium]